MKTVSLELSKQLKEAGYPQEASHYWCWNPNVQPNLAVNDQGHRPETGGNDMFCASPTADEILDQLPELKGWDLLVKLYSPDWYIVYELWHGDSLYESIGQWDDSLADAAAKMWLYIKKEIQPNKGVSKTKGGKSTEHDIMKKNRS